MILEKDRAPSRLLVRKGLVVGHALLSWSRLHSVDEHGCSRTVFREIDVRVVEKTREPLLELLLPPDVFGKVGEHLTQASEVLLTRLEKDVPLVLGPLAKLEERTLRHLVHRPHAGDVEAEVADREVVLTLRIEENDSFLRIVQIRLVLEQLMHVAVLFEGNGHETEFHAHRVPPVMCCSSPRFTAKVSGFYDSDNITDIAYMGLEVKPNRKSPYFRAFSRFMYLIKRIKNFLPPKLKYGSSRCFSTGSFAVLSGAAPPSFSKFFTGARGESRTLMTLRSMDFESIASAIPPPGQI